MEATCVTPAQLYGAFGFGQFEAVAALSAISLFLLPFAVFTALLAKQATQMKTKAIKVGIATFCIVIILLLTRLIWSSVSKPGDDVFNCYGSLIYLIVFVLCLFQFFVWVMAGYKTRWRPRVFDAIPALLVLTFILSGSVLGYYSYQRAQLLQLPRCESQNNIDNERIDQSEDG